MELWYKKFPSGNTFSLVRVIKGTLTLQNWFPLFVIFLAEQTFLWICFFPSLLTSSYWPSGRTILVRYSFTSLSTWKLLIEIGTGFSYLSTISPASVAMIPDYFWNAYRSTTTSRIRKWLQKPWTKILLVVNFGSKEKRSNQLQYWEQKTRSPKTTAKLITTCIDFFKQYFDWPYQPSNSPLPRGGHFVKRFKSFVYAPLVS